MTGNIAITAVGGASGGISALGPGMVELAFFAHPPS